MINTKFIFYIMIFGLFLSACDSETIDQKNEIQTNTYFNEEIMTKNNQKDLTNNPFEENSIEKLEEALVFIEETKTFLLSNNSGDKDEFISWYNNNISKLREYRSYFEENGENLEIINAIKKVDSELTKVYEYYEKVSSCEDFVLIQLPDKIIFNMDETINSTWNDGTKINTLKDYFYRNGMDITAGNYRIYKGTYEGENINQYYFQGQIGNNYYETRPETFYLEYEGNIETNKEGIILPKKSFKISPKNYTLSMKNKTSEDFKYELAFKDFNILNCNNIEEN